ncbi:hypothetical protein EYZ11_013274 [Aspergillus tanneri]|uniref:Uncharacterized protein n=1 Tax=Aspergillus tanneri TaxID=1220188 RepID=A0A4S3IYL0_9EURO|nr:hypothetical protein EYZ11_013274 [Aspergillus tanneri]
MPETFIHLVDPQDMRKTVLSQLDPSWQREISVG